MLHRRKTILPEPAISRDQAFSKAKELALLNQLYWDDETAEISLCDKKLSRLCWRIFTGIEYYGSGEDWSTTGQIDSATYLFIDAETGKFAGLGGLRSVTPAEKIPDQYFKLLKE